MIFRRKFSISQCPKKIVVEPFTVSLILDIEKFYASEVSHDFPSNIFCLTVPKHFVEEPFYAVFQESSSGKKFMDRGEG